MKSIKIFYILGWAGSISLAICALPQVVQVISKESAGDLNSAFLLLWLFGEVAMLVYLAGTRRGTSVLYFNYVLNSIFLLIIAYYKFLS